MSKFENEMLKNHDMSGGELPGFESGSIKQKSPDYTLEVPSSSDKPAKSKLHNEVLKNSDMLDAEARNFKPENGSAKKTEIQEILAAHEKLTGEVAVEEAQNTQKYNQILKEIKAESPKLSEAEKSEILKTANINDENILEKLAQVCGNSAESFHQNELNDLRKYANEGGHQPLEWRSPTTNDKFFIEDDGSIIMGSKSTW